MERTKVEVENKCFEMMQNRNAYMVLTAIRLVSLLEQSRKGEHRARDSIVVDHECQGDDDEKRTQRHARLRQVIHQTMALLSHREADARTEALDLLRVFVSGTRLPAFVLLFFVLLVLAGLAHSFVAKRLCSQAFTWTWTTTCWSSARCSRTGSTSFAPPRSPL